MQRHRVILASQFMFLCAIDLPQSRADKPSYPATPLKDVVEKIHGVEIHDPYRWLESESEPDVKAWVEKQNALTRGMLDRHTAEREAIAKRLAEFYAVPTSSSPSFVGGLPGRDSRPLRYFFTKREGKQNHAVVYMRKGTADAAPTAVLDPNTFSEDGTVALDWSYPSPDGTLILYGKSSSGNERSTLYLRDVDAGVDTALIIPNTRYSSIAWDKDNQGFHYTRYPDPASVSAEDANYFKHLYYHKFGTDWKNDPKVFGDGRPKTEFVSISNSDDLKYQFMTASVDWAKQDLFMRPAGTKDFTPVAVGLDGQFSPEVLGDKLYILTDYQAPRYRVMVTDVAKPGVESWKELIPQQKGVIEGCTIVGGKLVLNILENAYSKLAIFDTAGKPLKDIKLPTLGSVSGVSGRGDRDEMFFGFASFAYPSVVYRYDVKTDDMKVIERTEAPIDPEQYETKQVWFKSKDGTSVPMFVISKKGLKLDGNNPTVLYGYGGFDIKMTPRFDPKLFVWLDKGGVYAIANLRGGGEFGKEWHLDGRLGKKQNVFDDMIAAAEKLVADKYTRPERLGALGGSNGGLLMGAMMTQRPDLFKAIQCAVPLLDMVRYDQFSIAKLWVPEYGSATDPEQFKWLYAYSPYHHVKKGEKYPAVLFTTAESDSRVNSLHAMKMSAAMQAANASQNPILLWVETKAGHGQGKPITKVIESNVDSWIFFMSQLGMLDASHPASPGGATR